MSNKAGASTYHPTTKDANTGDTKTKIYHSGHTYRGEFVDPEGPNTIHLQRPTSMCLTEQEMKRQMAWQLSCCRVGLESENVVDKCWDGLFGSVDWGVNLSSFKGSKSNNSGGSASSDIGFYHGCFGSSNNESNNWRDTRRYQYAQPLTQAIKTAAMAQPFPQAHQPYVMEAWELMQQQWKFQYQAQWNLQHFQYQQGIELRRFAGGTSQVPEKLIRNCISPPSKQLFQETWNQFTQDLNNTLQIDQETIRAEIVPWFPVFAAMVFFFLGLVSLIISSGKIEPCGGNQRNMFFGQVGRCKQARIDAGSGDKWVPLTGELLDAEYFWRCLSQILGAVAMVLGVGFVSFTQFFIVRWAILKRGEERKQKWGQFLKKWKGRLQEEGGLLLYRGCREIETKYKLKRMRQKKEQAVDGCDFCEDGSVHRFYWVVVENPMGLEGGGGEGEGPQSLQMTPQAQQMIQLQQQQQVQQPQQMAMPLRESE